LYSPLDAYDDQRPVISRAGNRPSESAPLLRVGLFFAVRFSPFRTL
jgi:hypothetical protein